MSTFENRIITDTEDIKVKGPLSSSVSHEYLKGVTSRNKPVLIRRFSPETISFYYKELEGYKLLKDHANCLKIKTNLIQNSNGVIIYECPENLDFNHSLKYFKKKNKFINLLKQLIDILNLMHQSGYRYNRIDGFHLFFDKKFQLKIAGFSGMSQIQGFRSVDDETFRYLTGCSELQDFSSSAFTFDYLMLGEFLLKNEKDFVKCSKCELKDSCMTKNLLNSLIIALCNKNMTLRANYEDLVFMLDENFCCKKIGFFSKVNHSNRPEWLVRNLLNQLLLENDENFNVNYLNKIVFLLRLDLNSFKVFKNFFLDNKAPENYGVSIKMLIIMFYILFNIKFEKLSEISRFSFIDECIEEWFKPEFQELKIKDDQIKIIDILYRLIMFKIMTKENRARNSTESSRDSNYLSYLKRICEFLKIIFEEHNESLFHLKDLTLVMVVQEFYDLITIMRNFRMLNNPSEETEAIISNIASSLAEYKTLINLNLIKNIPISRYPLIFKQSLTDVTSFQIQSNFVSNRLDSVFEIPLEQLPFEHVFDMGGSCFMYKDVYKGQPIAIKELIQGHGNETKAFSREMSIMVQCFHPKIIQLLGTNTQARCLNLIYPFMSGTNLHILLHKLKFLLSANQKLAICIDICEAMIYLHKKNIIHRDLKPLNVLIEFKLNRSQDPISVKVSDFGDSRYADKGMTPRVGTVNWSSPEILAGRNYSFKSDVFSFGLLVWETFTQKIPYGEIEADGALEFRITSGFRPDVQEIHDDEFGGEIKQIVIQCFNSLPEKRPDFNQLYRRFRALIR